MIFVVLSNSVEIFIHVTMHLLEMKVMSDSTNRERERKHGGMCVICLMLFWLTFCVIMNTYRVYDDTIKRHNLKRSMLQLIFDENKIGFEQMIGIRKG